MAILWTHGIVNIICNDDKRTLKTCYSLAYNVLLINVAMKTVTATVLVRLRGRMLI